MVNMRSDYHHHHHHSSLLTMAVLMIGVSVVFPNGNNVVESYGLGKCPNYPSMENFNMSKVRTHKIFEYLHFKLIY